MNEGKGWDFLAVSDSNELLAIFCHWAEKEQETLGYGESKQIRFQEGRVGFLLGYGGVSV